MVPKQFHKWIKVFGKKASERMPMRKIYDYAIDLKKEFLPRKRKVYPLSREEKEEVREFIKEQIVIATTRPMSNSSTISKSQGRYLVGNTSCVIHKRTRQGTTTVFY